MSIIHESAGQKPRTGVGKARRAAPFAALTVIAIGVIAAAGCGGSDDSSGPSGLPSSTATMAQVQHGRALVTSMGCTDCHSHGVNDPSAANWLCGYSAAVPHDPGTFAIGPFTTYAANLTPSATGLGPVSDRQVFNALKHGLDPGASPNAVITGDTPGQGGFPATPHYLAPPMPWTATRHLSDSDLWDIVAYLKHGIKGVTNAPPASSGPPDFWASSYTPDKVGPVILPTYPATSEQFAP
ncbi:hypothetical protein CCAX7_20040 [Capsulimonas corticalis]|uniref:Uncharacterized protein n=1 Tax=Capsulimonas corticalis TaxID=2219043 RepID=A0A402D2H3_9BACT|nr:hypothetical protein [Capsulimonas corticalis]BDI29953.1 hypothetical protein CCAX7_20040 [Capsulimonas corticalis]